MDDSEMQEFLAFLQAHHNDIFEERKRARRPHSKRMLIVRLTTFGVVVVICSCASYVLHYEGILKGMEFLGAAATDKLLFGWWE